jgi:cytosine deaminase
MGKRAMISGPLVMSKRELLRGIAVTGTSAAMLLATGVHSNAEDNAMVGKTKGPVRAAPPKTPHTSSGLNLTPGVRPGSSTLRTAEEAAARTVDLAERAGKQGTFAVGGLLVDNSGRIIAEATNAVIRDGHLSDPTAHVERQLVDWFAHERRRGLAVSARNVTIVSSLDPCAMCAGAILRSGMRVITVAEDNYAGVHDKLRPLRMPEELRAQAEKDMAFFGVRGRRPLPVQDVAPIFASEVSAEHVDRSTSVFQASVKEVQQKVGGGGSDTGPRVFQPTAAVLSALREVAAKLGPHVKIGDGPLNVHERARRHELMKLLARDASVLVDEDGNFIVGSTGAESASSTRTSVLELIRAYTFIRRAMPEQFKAALPRQGYCSIVKRTAPSVPAKGLLELGATGSFLELARPTKKLPAMGFIERANLAHARAFAASLPPLYSDIGITVGRIELN